MAKMLRVLIVEDSETDCALLLRELSRVGYQVSHQRVETADAMRTSLAEQTWDAVLSDYTLPQFSGTAALRVLKESTVDLPFIIVSGTIGEDTAVEALKAGADDFLVKGRLARLGPALERGRRDLAVRQERGEALARVEESQRRLSAIFNQVAVGIVQTDLEGRVLSANQRFCDILMRPLEHILGLRMQEFTVPEDAAAMAKIFQRIAGGEHSFVIEQRYLSVDGSQVWVNNTVSGVTDSDSRPWHAVAVVEDITSRKRAEGELKLAVQARDEFLSIASHELKTPITSLVLQLTASLKLLDPELDAEIPREKLASQLSTAHRQVNRLVSLINNLLDVTLITSGRLTLSRKRADLTQLVTLVTSNLQDAVKRSRSELVIGAEGPVVGNWDPAVLETVVSNLISNALKFGEGKPVEITVDCEGDLARLVVVDHGLGIAPEEQSRIFQRFERAVPSKHFGGFGIGLWVARQGVEAHGGTIEVSSGKGTGSVFVVTLPLGMGAVLH